MAESREVLIVEDERVVLKVAGMALAAQGIGFQEATDVQSATALLGSTAFKVVVTDLKLPGDSGFEILSMAKGISPSPQVIVITGYATIENALQSFQQGAFDFIPKPFDVDELTSVAERALRFASQSGRATQTAMDRFSLGRHSWARLDPDGSATLGVAETVASVAGKLETIDCLKSGDHTIQGDCFCRLTAGDGLTHRVWAPLSGRIILQNSAIIQDPDLINRDPFGAGWIARVIPNRPDEELQNLRQPQISASG